MIELVCQHHRYRCVSAKTRVCFHSAEQPLTTDMARNFLGGFRHSQKLLRSFTAGSAAWSSFDSSREFRRYWRSRFNEMLKLGALASFLRKTLLKLKGTAVFHRKVPANIKRMLQSIMTKRYKCQRCNLNSAPLSVPVPVWQCTDKKLSERKSWKAYSFH